MVYEKDIASRNQHDSSALLNNDSIRSFHPDYSILPKHVSPEYPSGQVHVNLLTSSLHCPPFLHGFPKHSSTSKIKFKTSGTSAFNCTINLKYWYIRGNLKFDIKLCK